MSMFIADFIDFALFLACGFERRPQVFMQAACRVFMRPGTGAKMAFASIEYALRPRSTPTGIVRGGATPFDPRPVVAEGDELATSALSVRLGAPSAGRLGPPPKSKCIC